MRLTVANVVAREEVGVVLKEDSKQKYFLKQTSPNDIKSKEENSEENNGGKKKRGQSPPGFFVFEKPTSPTKKEKLEAAKVWNYNHH